MARYKLVNKNGRPAFIFGGDISFLYKDSKVYDTFGFLKATFLAKKHNLKKVKV